MREMKIQQGQRKEGRNEGDEDTAGTEERR